MTRSRVTVTIIALNEEKTLPAAINSAKWADEILVIDSGSTDKTVEIAKKHGAKVLSNPWSGYGQQKNFAQDNASFDWILNIDADEIIPPELANEIQSALTEIDAGGIKSWGFFFPRKTFYMNRWIRHGGWYPNNLVRFANRKHARWTEPNVHEELKVSGEVSELTSPLHHHTFANIEEQVLTNLRYSRFGSRDLINKGQKPCFWKLVFKPIGKFIETYILKLGLLDGLPGFIISVNAAHSIFLKYAFLFEVKRDESSDNF